MKRVSNNCERCPYYRMADRIYVSGATAKCKFCKKEILTWELYRMWRKFRFIPFKIPVGRCCRKCAKEQGLEERL
jgi:hypothetical protein